VTRQWFAWAFQVVGIIVTLVGLVLTWVDWHGGWAARREALVAWWRGITGHKQDANLQFGTTFTGGTSGTATVEVVPADEIAALRRRLERLEQTVSVRFAGVNARLDEHSTLAQEMASLIDEVRKASERASRRAATGGVRVALVGGLLVLLGTILTWPMPPSPTH
jgi:hypothetical protein